MDVEPADALDGFDAVVVEIQFCEFGEVDVQDSAEDGPALNRLVVV